MKSACFVVSLAVAQADFVAAEESDFVDENSLLQLHKSERVRAACGCPVQPREPVCGADGNTYDNECEAECSGRTAVTVVYQGECITKCEKWPVDPIRCAVGQSLVKAPFQLNGCDIPQYSCEDDPPMACPCPRNLQPVCGTDGKTYGNKCESECQGVEVVYDGECVADCSRWPVEPIKCSGGQRLVESEPTLFGGCLIPTFKCEACPYEPPTCDGELGLSVVMGYDGCSIHSFTCSCPEKTDPPPCDGRLATHVVTDSFGCSVHSFLCARNSVTSKNSVDGCLDKKDRKSKKFCDKNKAAGRCNKKKVKKGCAKSCCEF